MVRILNEPDLSGEVKNLITRILNFFIHLITHSRGFFASLRIGFCKTVSKNLFKPVNTYTKLKQIMFTKNF